MFLGIPLINWIFGFFMVAIGSALCTLPIAIIFYPVYVWNLTRQYNYIERKIGNFRFAYSYCNKNKLTIRIEYSKGWD